MAIGDPTLYKGYLGGHNWITHTDECALKYIQETFNIETMLDVGCGPGDQIRVAKSLGISAEGVDGDPRVVNENKDIIIHECDYTKDTFEKNVDLIWSTEFVEHVREQFQQNYMKTFSCSKYVLLTFAPPGKSGLHHVNLKPDTYWINLFEKHNFIYDFETTKIIREKSSMEREFVRNNGLFFRKNDS